MTTTSGPPIETPLILTTERSGRTCRLTSLKGCAMATTLSTPGAMAAPAAADVRYDGAFGAASHVRLVAGLADALDDVIDFLLGRFVGHVDDHGWILLVGSVVKTKAAIRSRLAAQLVFQLPVSGSTLLQAAPQPLPR